MNKLLLFFFLSTSLLQAKSTDVHLALAWKHQFQFAGYYIAKELGLYEKAGLNVHIHEYDATQNNSKNISHGTLDYAVGHSNIIYDKLTHYENLVLLSAIHQSSPLVLLALQKTEIQTLSDLKNKKVMINSNEIYAASINAMLLTNKLSPSMFTIVEENFNITNLINGTVDFKTAYISNEPYMLKEKGLKYTIFDPKEHGYDFYSDILFTSKEKIKNNPQEVAAFYKASLEGWIYAYKNIDETINLILKKYNTQGKSYEAYQFEAQTLQKLAFKDDVKFGSISKQRVQSIANTFHLLQLGETKQKIDYESFIYNYTQDINLEYTSLQENNSAPKTITFKVLNIQVLLTIALLFIIVLLLLYTRSQHKKQKNIFKCNSKGAILDKYIVSFIFDTQGNITSISSAMLHLCGYKENEIISKHYSVFTSSFTENESLEDCWLTISSGHTYKHDIYIKHKDGSNIYAYITIEPLFNSDKTILEYLSIFNIPKQELLLEN